MKSRHFLSLRGLALVKQSEDCELVAYYDKVGQCWTIGWGHTGPEVHAGLRWTQVDADQALWRDLKWACDEVNDAVTVKIDQGEFDALVDFTYNCGAGALKTSTMVRLLNEGHYDEAAAQFERWDMAKGKHVAGLLRRRLREREMFDEPGVRT